MRTDSPTSTSSLRGCPRTAMATGFLTPATSSMAPRATPTRTACPTNAVAAASRAVDPCSSRSTTRASRPRSMTRSMATRSWSPPGSTTRRSTTAAARSPSARSVAPRSPTSTATTRTGTSFGVTTCPGQARSSRASPSGTPRAATRSTPTTPISWYETASCSSTSARPPISMAERRSSNGVASKATTPDRVAPPSSPTPTPDSWSVNSLRTPLQTVVPSGAAIPMAFRWWSTATSSATSPTPTVVRSEPRKAVESTSTTAGSSTTGPGWAVRSRWIPVI